MITAGTQFTPHRRRCVSHTVAKLTSMSTSHQIITIVYTTAGTFQAAPRLPTGVALGVAPRRRPSRTPCVAVRSRRSYSASTSGHAPSDGTVGFSGYDHADTIADVVAAYKPDPHHQVLHPHRRLGRPGHPPLHAPAPFSARPIPTARSVRQLLPVHQA